MSSVYRAIAAAAAIFVLVLAGAGIVGCRERQTKAAEPIDNPAKAPTGSMASVDIPVGPVPGPPNARQPLPDNPFAGDQAAAVEGRRLFVRFNCSGCHGGRAGGGMGPSLRDPDWIYGGSPAKIHDSIVHGRAHGMPAWGTMIPDEYAWKLTSYIQSLGTPNEPHPPQ